MATTASDHNGPILNVTASVRIARRAATRKDRVERRLRGGLLAERSPTTDKVPTLHETPMPSGRPFHPAAPVYFGGCDQDRAGSARRGLAGVTPRVRAGLCRLHGGARRLAGFRWFSDHIEFEMASASSTSSNGEGGRQFRIVNTDVGGRPRSGVGTYSPGGA